MCNEYQLKVKRDAFEWPFDELHAPVRWADAEPNRDPDTPIKPTDRATILRPLDPADPRAGLEGLELRWWLVPPFHKGPLKDWRSMCTNARIETLDTAPTFREAYRRRRCLVPLTSFFEYAEPPGWKKGQPKTRHEISWPDGGVRFFAGIWERAHPADLPEGLESFAFVTGLPGPDIAPFHDRAPVVLTAAQGLEWLNLDGPGKAALEILPPAGTFQVAVKPRDSIMSAAMRKALF